MKLPVAPLQIFNNLSIISLCIDTHLKDAYQPKAFIYI